MKTFFTPGPSQLYPGLQSYIVDAFASHIMSISHRSDGFSEIFNLAANNLRALLDIPRDYHIFFVGSATEAMERVIQNMAQQRTHHFVAGAFGERFYEIAQELGKNATATRVPWGHGFKAADFTVPAGVELATFVQNETSAGTALNMPDIYRFKRAHPNVLVAVDVVSSAPIVALDFAHLDCVFFSVQKAFGLPAGLGVLIVGPAALERAHQLAKKSLAGSFHSFRTLAKSAAKAQTPETPNVLGMYLLGRVAADMVADGIETLRRVAAKRAMALYEVLETHPALEPFVKDPAHRSQTVIVAEVRDSHALARAMAEQGLVVGKGYSDYKDVHLRIANFPATHPHTDRLIAALWQDDAS